MGKTLWKATLKIRLFGLLKVPALLFVSPSVVELSQERCVVRIPLVWRTKNHYRTMYIGVLCAGADVAGGLMAMQRVEATGKDIRLLFKDFKADFLKRADGDVYFTCSDGPKIGELVQKVIDTGERQNGTVQIIATVPSKSDEPVARFDLTLSLK